jgi:uncharacterized membrane protein
MSWFRDVQRRRRKDERGAVLVLAAISMIALLAAGAMGVDVGFSVVGSRTAQAMADTAALDLAKDINIADVCDGSMGCNNAGVQSYLNNQLGNVLTDNGSDADMSVVPGLYLNGKWTIPIKGCAPTTPPAVYPCNAIMVAAAQSVPQPFWGGFNSLTGFNGTSSGAGGVGTNCGVSPNPAGVCTPPSSLPSCLTTGGCSAPTPNNGSNGCPAPFNSCVTWSPETSFSIGSYLANYDSQQTAVLGDILGDGSSVDITAAGYQGLATSSVTLGQLLTAAGTFLSPSTVMTTAETPSQWLSILNIALGNQIADESLSCGQSPTPEQCNAQTALGQLSWSGGTGITLCHLFSISDSSGTYNCNNLATTYIDYSALSTSLDVLQMLTTIAELTNGSSAIDVTSALSLPGVLTSDLTLDVVQPAQVAYGPAGTAATTAQVSADLSLTLPALGQLNIPLSAAEGTATLRTIDCDSNNNMYLTNINASTTAATAAVTLGGAAVATLTFSGASTNTLSYGAGVVPPTSSTATANPATNPVQLGTTSSTPSITGTTGLDTGLVNTLLGTTLSAGTLTSILSPVLQAAGVTLAGANVADLGYVTSSGTQEGANCTAVEVEG